MANADLDESDYDLVLEVLRSGRLTMGPKTDEFERITAEYCGAKHAVAVNSGTAGLHLLCIIAGLKPGDEVITPSFSFAASTNCFLYLGATPVFVDIEPETYCIDPELIEGAITSRTKAILAVDVFGHPADWNKISAIAQRHDLKLISDACESLGAEYEGQKAGPFGIGGVFAYFPNKQVTTGEGGMIVTNDPDVWHVGRSLRNQGRDEIGGWLGHTRLGYNYRIDELSAALGVAQMRRIEQLLAKRKTVAALYNELLKKEHRVRTPRVRPRVQMSHFVYVIELQEGLCRDDVMRGLEERGVPSRGYFSPIHQQQYIRELLTSPAPPLPVTERVAARTIALPFHNNLSSEEVAYVVSALKDVLDRLS